MFDVASVQQRCRAIARCMLLALLIMAGQAHGQEAQTIEEITYTGLNRMEPSYVQDLVRVRVGDSLDRDALDAAVGRLLRTGRFLTATYDVQPGVAGVLVRFALAERATVVSLAFEGNKKFGDRRLAEEIAVKVGEPVDWFLVRGGVESIAALYRQAGYTDVTVTFDRAQLESTGVLVYTIGEGARIRIRDIEFEGTTAFSDRKLKRKIGTKEAFSFLRTGAYDEDKADADVAIIQRFYRDEGYLDARVTCQTELAENGEDLTVLFSVTEGDRYAVEELVFEGNRAFATEDLFALIDTAKGQAVKPPVVEADAQRIRERYGELGYIYADVRPVRVFSDKPGLVRITFQVEEGAQFRVGRVVVRGNTRTRDKVVRRVLNLYPPDDLLNLTEAREAERHLTEMPIFASARVYPVGDAPGLRDVVIDVEEAERSGDFIFGFGVTSDSGVLGTFVLDLQNFDWRDKPRNFEELVKFRSFFGGGQRLRIEAQPGTEVTRLRVDFTEPYLFDKPVRFDMGAYLFERGRDGYVERRGGGNVSLGKRFQRGWLQSWTGEVALRVENVTISDVDLFTSKQVREDKGGNLMSSIKLALARDRTDSRLLPTKGDRMRMAYEQFGVFGGDHFFGKLTGSYTWYKTMRVDTLDRKSVFSLKAEGGAIIGDAPVFERFFAGGTGSIRGFDYRGVGPRDGIDDTNVGGETMLLLSGEYSFPLIGETIRGMFFVDTGAVPIDVWRASVGTGIRLNLNFLGPLPLEFNLALPVVSEEDDEERIFSFLIGTAF